MTCRLPSTKTFSVSGFVLVVCLLGIQVSSAVVYDDRLLPTSPTRSFDPTLQERGASQRKYLLNGNRLDGRLAYSDKTPKELIALVHADWTEQVSKSVGKDESLGLRLNKPIVSNGENWAMFANLNLFAKPKATIPGVVSQKYLVFAMQPSEKSLTDVWILSIPDEVNPLALFRSSSPPNDINPFPGSVLSWSMVEATNTGESELYVFSGPGSAEQQNRHYMTEYSKLGFRLDEKVAEKDTTTTRIMMSRGGVQVDVVSSVQSKSESDIISIIQVRKKRH